MKFSELVKWNSRVSVVYAVGMWTMICSYGFYRYVRRDEEDAPVKKEEMVMPEVPNQVIYQTAYSKTIVTYKKDFVPFSTRIDNFIKSFSSEPGTGASDK